MRDTIEIVHEGDLGRIQANWWQWKYAMGRKAWSLYETLRRPELDGTTVDVKRLAGAVGMSKTALYRSLEQLEEAGLVTVVED